MLDLKLHTGLTLGPIRTGVQIEPFNLCFWGFSLNQNVVKSEHGSNWETVSYTHLRAHET